MDCSYYEYCIGLGLFSLVDKWNLGHDIYHYTSPNGLIGILGDKPKYRFTHSSYVNDTEEGKNILVLYERVLETLAEEGSIDYGFKELISMSLIPSTMFCPQVEGETLVFGERSVETYICCFSMNRDSLPMWNYYSKEGRYEGYNIGMHFFEERANTVKSQQEVWPVFFKVIYDDDHKTRILSKLVKDMYQYYCEDKGRITSIKKSIELALAEVCFAFKNKCFQHEEEIRAIYRLTDEKMQSCIEYRAKDGYIIPYIEIEFPKECVMDITCGPLISVDATREAVFSLLKTKSYSSSIEIHSSDIPVRF